jgi:light-regulated signal transduction histidine kinase (bacteriophytochrome)
MARDSGRQVQWKIAAVPSAWCDPVFLRQVLLNLMGNAMKYSRNREVAQIEIDGSKQHGETIFLIRDNGAGFDMKYSAKLFGVFQRLHSDAEFEGNGVGLALVQRIIHRHGGRVWAEGKPGEGATFYFSLPNPDTAHTGTI